MAGRPDSENNLHYAVNMRCYAIVELLVSSGFGVNSDRDSDTQIMHGFGPFATSSWVYVRGERAIHIAARNGDLEMIKLLAKLNADLTAKMTGPETGYLGDSPYDISYKLGFKEVFDFIDQEINKTKKN